MDAVKIKLLLSKFEKNENMPVENSCTGVGKIRRLPGNPCGGGLRQKLESAGGSWPPGEVVLFHQVTL
jgi:hypothetical protein